MEKFLTVKQLSEILQVSRRTIYDWSHTGFIPHYKLPKGVRFKIAEIEKWLLLKRRKGRNKFKINI
ncbi:MAG: helix-turn-helix domain-containing protein [Candidatus Pacebacteria bacterium]|nr:helix-turn-helix domain-containing protein [Candidatus Paceibacterota bacterium]